MLGGREGLGGAFRTGEKPEWGCFWLWVGLGGEGTRVGLSGAEMGKRDGWEWRRFIGAVFWRRRLGRVVVGTLKGSGRLEGWRVGEGSSGRVSSSSSRMTEERGEEEYWVGRRCFCVAAANMFLLL